MLMLMIQRDVLCLLLLPRGRLLERDEPWFLRRLRQGYDRALVACVARPRTVLTTTAIELRVVDPRKVERGQKHIAAYLAALDRRLD